MTKSLKVKPQTSSPCEGVAQNTFYYLHKQGAQMSM